MPFNELQRRISAAGIEARGDNTFATLESEKPDWVGGAISNVDARFLAGLLHYSGARNAVEIGVASGWSSAVMLKSMEIDFPLFQMHGVDLSPTYYLDKSKDTGAVVSEVMPHLVSQYNLHLGNCAFDAMADIGSVDFAFIDGHHMHPWATIDFISVLPYLSRGRWVVMHDLNLCTYERHRHTQRGPFYLFYLWPDQKLHSTQVPPMIGGVVLERDPEDYLPFLLEVLYTPWEMHPGETVIQGFLTFVGQKFGTHWQEKFADACARNDKTGERSV
jgi:predicted O-methyltransferase YrrM